MAENVDVNPLDGVYTASLLDSPVYNPSLDDTTVSLYKLMDNEPDAGVIADFQDVFTSMPTNNPYTGVLYNPRACEVDAIKTELEEVAKEIDDRYQEIINQGTPGDGRNPTPGQIIDLENWNNNYPGLSTDIGTVGNILDQYHEHTDRIIANFPSMVGMIQNSIGNNSAVNGLGQGTGLGGAGGGSPCIPFGDFLGSLLQAGQQLLGQLMGALNNLKGMVQQAMAMIQQAMAQLMQMAQQILAKIQQEIMNFVMGMLNMAKMGLAALMSFLPNDPCLQSIIGGLMTNGANKVMSKVGGILS